MRTFGGRAVPQPVMTRAADVRGMAGMSDRPQPGDGLAQRDPFAVDRDVALQHAGERRADLRVATWPSTVPTSMRVPSPMTAERGEHAGGGLTTSRSAGEQVLALVLGGHGGNRR